MVSVYEGIAALLDSANGPEESRSSRPWNLRRAMAEDIPFMAEMAVKDLGEAYAGKIVPNPAHIAHSLTFLIDHPDGLAIVAETPAGGRIGMMGALRHYHHVSGELGTGELFMWVHPEWRDGKGPGLSLFRTLERWARQMGCKWLHLTAPTAELEKAYEAIGFEKVEVQYQKRLDKPAYDPLNNG